MAESIALIILACVANAGIDRFRGSGSTAIVELPQLVEDLV